MNTLYLYLILYVLNGSFENDIIVKKLRGYRIQKKEERKVQYKLLEDKRIKKEDKRSKNKNNQFFKMEEIDNYHYIYLFLKSIIKQQKIHQKIPMEVGNSEIKKYLSQFWNSAHELDNQFKVNSNQTQAGIAQTKIRGLKQMMHGLVQYILSGYITPKQQLNMDEIFAKLGSEFDFKGQQCNLILAFAAKQQIFNNAFLHSIQKKIIKVFQSLQNISLSSQQYDIEFDQTTNSLDHDKKIEQIQNPYVNEKEIDMITQSESHDRSNNTIAVDFDESQEINLIDFKEDQNYNSDYFKIQNEQVKQYLYKLSKSTTELSYLCQRMKWSQPEFKQDKSKINQVLYACKASVNVKMKENFLQMNNVCTGAVSKKQAKRVAALFLLRKIYNRIPQAWTRFQESKKKNPMIQLELNANNEQIFKKQKFQVLDPSVFKEQELKISECEISKKINQYLDTLKSFKSEMNLIVGRFKKISQPDIKPQKQDALSLWPVTTQIFDEDGTKLHFYAKQMSKKKAEQTCCRQILFQLYRRNIPRWEQFLKYKKQKSLN